MSYEDKRAVAYTILLYRYVNHRLSGTLTLSEESEGRRLEAIRLAKEAGVYPEYVRECIENPVLTVRVKELE